jgi:hypothetical protein
MAHVYNPSSDTRKLRQENFKFKASLSYIVKTLSQKSKG